MNEVQAMDALERELRQLISTPVRRRLFLASLPLLLAGCSSVPKTRMREGDNSGQVAALTPAEERKMADEYGPQMEKEYPPLQDDVAQSYLKELGQKVVKANKLEGQPYNYRFTLVNADMVNAFALPA